MKKEDLRIGNYVKGLEVGIVRTIGNACAFKTPTSTVKIYAEDLEPIPLTEEWLFKFGFEPNRIYTQERVFEIGDGWFQLTKESKDQWALGNEQTYLAIKHVHQLQNLYHALTGKELTIS